VGAHPFGRLCGRSPAARSWGDWRGLRNSGIGGYLLLVFNTSGKSNYEKLQRP